MRLSRAPYAVLERLAKGMTVPEIDRALHITSSRHWARVLVKRGAVSVLDPGTKPFRFRLNKIGRDALNAGVAPRKKNWKQYRTQPERDAVRAGFYDLILRVFLARGGPLNPTEIATEMLVSRSFTRTLLCEMRDLDLVRVSTLADKNPTGSPTPLWAITHVGIERLFDIDQADWRARVAAVLPEAA